MIIPCSNLLSRLKELFDLRYARRDHTHGCDYYTKDEVDDLVANIQGVRVGDIKMIAYGPAPDGWLTCDGTTLLIGDYPELYAVIGNTFEPDPQPFQFRLPNFRSIFPIGTDFFVRSIGDTDGEAEHLLSVPELPAHDHPNIEAANAFVYNMGAGGGYFGVAEGDTYRTYKFTGLTGGDQPHNNMPPSLCVHFVIYAGR